jgi:hypothetical protein
MFNRKEKEREIFSDHLEKFRRLGVLDPFFVVKTAFFQKGKHGKQFQLFESELKRGEDIYIEFIDITRDDQNREQGIVPTFPERQLFKHKANPYYAEEYEVKGGTNAKGEPYSAYVIPLSELIAVMSNGTELTFSQFEKKRAEEAEEKLALPKLQTSLSAFPDFEDEYLKKNSSLTLDLDSDAPITDLTIKDFAAIMLMKPVSNKEWLNELVMSAKSDL